jgi:two-component system sensor kinase FixL
MPAGELSKLALVTVAKERAWAVLPVVMADMDSGEILFVSPPACQTFGYAAEDELLGRPIEALVPDDVSPAHATWRKDSPTPRTRMMGAGRRVRGKRKDGSLFDAHVSLTGMEEMGRKVGIAIVTDLSGVV